MCAQFRFRIKCAVAAPLPERQNVPILPHFGGQIEQRAIKRRPVIISEIDKSRFLNKPAQFNQVARALPPLHHPLPRISAALGGFSPANGALRSHHCLVGCRNLMREPSSRAVERMLRPLRATPPLFPHRALLPPR